jgi:hypothetical protein
MKGGREEGRERLIIYQNNRKIIEILPDTSRKSYLNHFIEFDFLCDNNTWKDYFFKLD